MNDKVKKFFGYWRGFIGSRRQKFAQIFEFGITESSPAILSLPGRRRKDAAGTFQGSAAYAESAFPAWHLSSRNLSASRAGKTEHYRRQREIGGKCVKLGDNNSCYAKTPLSPG
jgi:hypothetical protein